MSVARAAYTVFRRGMRLTGNTVLYLENRPIAGRGRKFFEYHHLLREAFQRAVRGRGPFAAESLEGRIAADRRFRRLVERGLTRGEFQEATRIGGWIAAANRKLPKGKAPLRLVVAKAEMDIGDLRWAFTGRRQRPAGVILSGSPKMLSRSYRTDPVVRETVEFTRVLLAHEVPTLGICFGMHLMAYARYGALVRWLRNPMVEGGKRLVVCGAETITKRGGSRVRVLQSHGQYLPFSSRGGIPKEAVLAHSRHGGVSLIEVLRCGPVAYGTEFHPEFAPQFLRALLGLPVYRRWIMKGGCDPVAVEAGLRRFSNGLRDGQQYGYDWVMKTLLRQYIS